MKHPLVDINEIPKQGSKIIDFFGRSAHVYYNKGVPRAVMNTCMHFGGPLDFAAGEGKFVCQWHQAEFDCDGSRIKGPAPSQSHLLFLSTRVEDNTLYYVWGE